MLTDGTFRPLTIPPEFNDHVVVAARSYGPGFRIAIIEEDSDAAWVLTVDADGTARVAGQVAPAYTPGFRTGDLPPVAALDGSGALYQSLDGYLLRRGLGESAPVELRKCTRPWCEYEALISGP
jgi:hypothetical protein